MNITWEEVGSAFLNIGKSRITEEEDTIDQLRIPKYTASVGTEYTVKVTA